MSLSKTDKEWILLNLKPIMQSVDTIQKTTAATNGKVLKHEEQLMEFEKLRPFQEQYFKKVDEVDVRLDALEKEEVRHVLNCPVSPKLRAVEDKLLSQSSVYKVMGIMFTGGIALGGFIVALIKLWH